MSKKRIAAIVLALSMTLSLCGCAFETSVEELFTLPQVPVEYGGLMKELENLIDDGYEYASPASGKSTQSVQMVDLNGDGLEEAVAFFRRSSDEKPLKIFVFQGIEDDYQLLCTMASSGSSIDSVHFEDLTGDGKMEIVVGWKISSDVQTLAVYSVGREFISLVSTPYIRFAVQDIDGNGGANLLVLRTDTVPVCECYAWLGDALQVTSRAVLSSTAAEISRGTVIAGQLEGMQPALFVTGVSEELSAVTDILVYQHTTGLSNLATDSLSGKTAVVYPYQQLPPQDINGDGVTEIPSPVVDNVLHQNMVSWFAYGAAGHCHQVAETYHSQTQGWYFTMPQSWWGHASAVEQELTEGDYAVTISVNGEEAVTLYKFSGDDREEQATAEGLTLISRQTAANYAGKLLTARAGITPDELRHSFYLPDSVWG